MSSILENGKLATTCTLPQHIQGGLHALKLIFFLQLAYVLDVSESCAKGSLRRK